MEGPESCQNTESNKNHGKGKRLEVNGERVGRQCDQIEGFRSRDNERGEPLRRCIDFSLPFLNLARRVLRRA